MSVQFRMESKVFFLLLQVNLIFGSCADRLCAQPVKGSTQDTSLIRISKGTDVRQHIYPEGINYFCTPFLRHDMFGLQDTREYVIVYYNHHLAVFDKSKKFWRIFTIADGYQHMEYPEKVISNYTDFFAVAGSVNNGKDTSDVVNVFDKKNFRVFHLSTKDFLAQEKKWQKEDYTNVGEEWSVQGDWPNGVIHKDKKTGATDFYSYDYDAYNYISAMATDGNKLVAVTPYGIRTEYPDGKNTFFSCMIQQGGIKELKLHDKRVLLLSDSTIEIRDDSAFNILYSLRFRSYQVHADFNDKQLFYSTDSTFFVVDIATQQVLKSFPLGAQINGITYDANSVLIEGIGFSVYDVHKQTLTHFLGNRDRIPDDLNNEDNGDGYYTTVRWIGKSGQRYFGLKRGGYYETIPNDTLMIYDVKTGTVSEEIKQFFPQALIDTITHQPYKDALVQGDYLSFKQAYPSGLIGLYHMEGDTFSEIQRFSLKTESRFPNVFQPEAYLPYGESVNQQTFFNNQLWIATDKGLFSYDMAARKWTSHHVPSSYMGGIGGIFATHEGVYCTLNSGYGNRQGIPLARMDRKTFQISYYENTLWDAYSNSYKYGNKEVIWATNQGIRKYDFTSKTFSLIPTPDPIRLVEFIESGYLAANKSVLYVFDRSGNLTASHRFKKELPEDEYVTAPTVLYADGADVWVAGDVNGLVQLTRFNINTLEETTFDLQGMGLTKIFADEKYVWMFRAGIARYDKKNGTLYEFTIAHPSSSQSIIDVIDADSVIYAVATTGIYEIHKSTFAIRKSRIPFLGNAYGTKITGSDGAYFITLHDGILQINADTLIKSFAKEGNDAYYYHKLTKASLADTRNTQLHIHDTRTPYEIVFNLTEELRGKSELIFNEHYPVANLKGFLDGKEITITAVTSFRTPVQIEGPAYNPGLINAASSWYRINITPVMLSRKPKEVALYYVKDEKKMLIKTWSIVID